MLKNIKLLAASAAPAGKLPSHTGWEAWPFSGFGTLTFWGLLAKVIFVALIFMGIAYLLRYLFRPGGPWRGEGWETIEEARARRDAEENGLRPNGGTDSDNNQTGQQKS